MDKKNIVDPKQTKPENVDNNQEPQPTSQKHIVEQVKSPKPKSKSPRKSKSSIKTKSSGRIKSSRVGSKVKSPAKVKSSEAIKSPKSRKSPSKVKSRVKSQKSKKLKSSGKDKSPSKVKSSTSKPKIEKSPSTAALAPSPSTKTPKPYKSKTVHKKASKLKQTGSSTTRRSKRHRSSIIAINKKNVDKIGKKSPSPSPKIKDAAEMFREKTFGKYLKSKKEPNKQSSTLISKSQPMMLTKSIQQFKSPVPFNLISATEKKDADSLEKVIKKINKSKPKSSTLKTIAKKLSGSPSKTKFSKGKISKGKGVSLTKLKTPTKSTKKKVKLSRKQRSKSKTLVGSLGRRDKSMTKQKMIKPELNTKSKSILWRERSTTFKTPTPLKSPPKIASPMKKKTLPKSPKKTLSSPKIKTKSSRLSPKKSKSLRKSRKSPLKSVKKAKSPKSIRIFSKSPSKSGIKSPKTMKIKTPTIQTERTLKSILSEKTLTKSKDTTEKRQTPTKDVVDIMLKTFLFPMIPTVGKVVTVQGKQPITSIQVVPAEVEQKSESVTKKYGDKPTTIVEKVTSPKIDFLSERLATATSLSKQRFPIESDLAVIGPEIEKEKKEQSEKTTAMPTPKVVESNVYRYNSLFYRRPEDFEIKDKDITVQFNPYLSGIPFYTRFDNEELNTMVYVGPAGLGPSQTTLTVRRSRTQVVDPSQRMRSPISSSGKPTTVTNPISQEGYGPRSPTGSITTLIKTTKVTTKEFLLDSSTMPLSSISSSSMSSTSSSTVKSNQPSGATSDSGFDSLNP